jgi:hypothetical protein
MDLFDAFAQEKLPKDQGYIVSSFFHDSSSYAIFEVVSYSGVKQIRVTETGLEFQTTGKKLHVLVEPVTYPQKTTEPYLRKDTEQIPKRFKELECVVAKNQTRIYVAKQPVETFSSFLIARPTGINFSFVFYNLPDIYDSIGLFFELSINRDCHVPQADARKVGRLVKSILPGSMQFEGEFGGKKMTAKDSDKE